MAKYRSVYINIWKDPDFENYSTTMKLMFLYLCTNGNTTESGIYPITLRTISNETGIPIKTVGKLLVNGLKNVVYDFKCKFIFVKNFIKYNGGGRPDLLKKSIEKDYKLYKTEFWNEFIKIYPEWSDNLKPIISNPNSNTNSISNINTKEQLANSFKTVIKERKYKCAEFVLLTKKELRKLIKDYGRKYTKKFVIKLNAFKGSKGKTYKSDYLAILNWVVEAILKDKDKEAIQEAKIKEKEWAAQKDDYEWKPIPKKVKEQTHKVLNIPDRDKLNKTKGG